MAAGQPEQVLSDINHLLTLDGAWVRKTAKPGREYDIQLDYAVNAALGRNVRSVRYGEFEMPHWGHPVRAESLTSESLQAMVDGLARARSDAAANLDDIGLPDLDDCMDAALGMVQLRFSQMGGGHEAAAQDCLARFGQVKAGSLMTPALGLVHGDPHCGNWLRQPDGSLILIDWESAMVGPAAIDHAALFHSVVLLERTDLASDLLARISLDDVLISAWYWISAKAISWLLWVTAKGESSPAEFADRVAALAEADRMLCL